MLRDKKWVTFNKDEVLKSRDKIMCKAADY